MKVRIQDFAKEKGKTAEWMNEVEDRLDKVSAIAEKRFCFDSST